MLEIGMLCVALAVMLLPLFVKRIGQELEIFLFVMGVLAVTITGQWSGTLVIDALREPWKITAAVLAAGMLFHFFTAPLERGVARIRQTIGTPALAALIVVLVGLLSSVITAIIASLVLVESVRCMKLDRKEELRMIVLACFSIGLGAALTPIGEPLATVAIAKLSHAPYEAGFLAAKAYRQYRSRGGARHSPLPDFFIGAHAAVSGYRLLTRDAARYRIYFPSVPLITP